MARRRKRQANGAPWHRKFDDCWYATIDGNKTKLRDEAGQPIKGKDFRQQADLAVARTKLQIEPVAAPGDVLVATVVSAYLTHLEATASPGYHELATRTMNDFCSYCGGLKATDLKKKHVRDWIAKHPGWKSDNTKCVTNWDHWILVPGIQDNAPRSFDRWVLCDVFAALISPKTLKDSKIESVAFTSRSEITSRYWRDVPGKYGLRRFRVDDARHAVLETALHNLVDHRLVVIGKINAATTMLSQVPVRNHHAPP